MAAPLTVLTFGWHLGYLRALSHLPHRFDLVPRLACDQDEPWVLNRLLPANVRLVSWDRAAESVRHGRYRALVAHHPSDLTAGFPTHLRRLVVFHHRPDAERLAGGHDAVAECASLSEGATRVFPSEADRERWGLDGVVVPHGIALEDYPETTREESRVLLNRHLPFSIDDPARDRALLDVVGGLPLTATGLGLSGSTRQSRRDDAEWRAALATHRVLLHAPAGPEPAAGAWSLLEAMASGVPAVALDGDEEAVLDDRGVCHEPTVEGARRRLLELLEKPDAGAAIGGRGRAWIAAHYPVGPFVAAWEALLG